MQSNEEIRKKQTEDQDKAQAEIQRMIQEIANHGICIFDLLQPGMTVEVKITEKQLIVTPGQPKRMQRLYITRPISFLTIATG